MNFEVLWAATVEAAGCTPGGLVAVLIPASGPPTLTVIEYSLTALQRCVNGSIEGLDLSDGCRMYLNEDGKGLGLPLNSIATAITRDIGLAPGDLIVGDVVVIGPLDGEDESHVTEERARQVLDLAE